ncbi:hypothetical protein BLNAU_17364 [Blattamonas nauphoetae]|uniref:Uncharacterized protein n=1 Tax=Blattamonas nauphoetae TaxID=2049346 RepID=A0ABQ9XA05_9EUKA|nr:hypothetical protein BLNAU_17364 [Blattamonas nauphoetae]
MAQSFLYSVYTPPKKFSSLSILPNRVHTDASINKPIPHVFVPCRPTPELIQKSAASIVNLLKYQLPDIFEDQQSQKEDNDVVETLLKEMLDYLKNTLDVSTVEMIHSLYLLILLVDSDVILRKRGDLPAIALNNLCTILLCTTLVAVKFQRDTPPHFLDWASLFEVTPSFLVSSEINLLNRIHHAVWMSNESLEYILRVISTF